MKSECAKRKEFAERLKACIWCVVSIKKEPVLSPTGEIGRHKSAYCRRAKARHKARIGVANRAHGARIEPNGRDRATQSPYWRSQ